MNLPVSKPVTDDMRTELGKGICGYPYALSSPPPSTELLMSPPSTTSLTFLRTPTCFFQKQKPCYAGKSAMGWTQMPLVVFEGRRRAFTLKGAKEVEDYLAVVEKLVKETT